MSRESDFIAALARLATHPAARGLADDAAVLPPPAADLVLTHDMLVEGVHFLATDPPQDVARKLVAVNLSDLAAKGATPIGALMGYGLGADPAWDRAFLDGLEQALARFATPLLGGDTVAMPAGTPRAIGLTAIGTSPCAPARSGAKPGDRLWVTGPIGDAGLGLRIARGDRPGPDVLRDAYRRPEPRLAEGRALAPHVHAMADISDGLLIDAARMAAASGLAVAIDLAAIPLSPEAVAFAGDDRAARLAAATAGDDYQLLFAAAEDATLPPLPGLAPIGRFAAGSGLSLGDGAEVVPLPARLGYEHGAS
ncbi:thiamine-phosphate kinase [Sphingomonas oleivorans]|uniref:Thiamine-monophosphate kinase n=1 Tax=Sphingomonas oleivorans TaxID=1735121 RepID=A0A2T5G1Q1_9SPHN|nr:thiamine-phosphate kinase [Sphingomonas oleivorans]PTQ13073.1 thiamine-phosphate kinase [Sphingomonas oleivorans]